MYNPGNFGTPTQLSWASLTGQNFTAQHNSPHIDFCGAHFWPDRWVRARPQAAARARAPPVRQHPATQAPGRPGRCTLCPRQHFRLTPGVTRKYLRRRVLTRLLRRASRAWLMPATEPRLSWRQLCLGSGLGLGLALAEATPLLRRQTPDLGWNAAFFAAWVDGHAADCAALGKPFILEEFGKNVTVPVTPAGIAATRDPAFASVYAKLLASLTSGGGFQARRPRRRRLSAIM